MNPLAHDDDCELSDKRPCTCRSVTKSAQRNRIDPHYANILRQIVKMTGKEKVLNFVRSL